MANLIDTGIVSFVDGTAGQATAAKLNAIVTATNQAIAQLNNLQSSYDSLTKIKNLVVAKKSSLLDLGAIAGGTAFGIPGWSTSVNVGSGFNAATGVFTVPELGVYDIRFKALLEVDTATNPRAKVWLSKGGTEISLDEKGIATYQGAYRNSYFGWFRDTLNPGDLITLQIQVWSDTALTGRIKADQNTAIVIDRVV